MSETVKWNELKVAGFFDSRPTTLDTIGFDTSKLPLQQSGIGPFKLNEGLLNYGEKELLLIVIIIDEIDGHLVLSFPRYEVTQDGTGVYVFRGWPFSKWYLVTVDIYGYEHVYKVISNDNQYNVTKIEYLGLANNYMLVAELNDGSKVGFDLGWVIAGIAVGEIVEWLLVAAGLVVAYEALKDISKWLDVEKYNDEYKIRRLKLFEDIVNKIKSMCEQGKLSKSECTKYMADIGRQVAADALESSQGDSISDKILNMIKTIALPFGALLVTIITLMKIKMLFDIIKDIFSKK